MGKRPYVYGSLEADAREGIPGCVVAQHVRCGKPTCRCARGHLHGPYFAHYWREDGRARKRYLERHDAPRVAALCTRYRAQHPSTRALRRELRAMARWLDQLDAQVPRRER